MEFTNLYNIKTEQVGGWNPPAGAHLTAMQTVNPFMHLAARAVTTNVPASITQTKVEKQQAHTTANTVHIVQVPTTHQVHQPANDTAFPGAAPPAVRHNQTAAVQQPQQAHIIQPNTQYTIKQQAPEQTHANKTTISYTTHSTGQQQQQQAPREKPPKPRMYKCGECDKAFVRDEHLKRHTLTHTGQPMHRCDVPGCNKTYTTKYLLTNHLKYIHLGIQQERAFLCIDCGKDFVRRDYLQRHRKNVHGTGPKAPGGQVISRPVVQHVVQQPQYQQGGGKRPKDPNDAAKRKFHCDTCGKDFKRKDHLQRHQKNVHQQLSASAAGGGLTQASAAQQAAAAAAAPAAQQQQVAVASSGAAIALTQQHHTTMAVAN
eukprot:TRINITY_DN8273_c0_g1_i4.p1 TRINITY_DN8273_c0_g1~~TRINITY_DN8273_c0_g1_i4.p1  ORF type:complete len:373 (-),score=115.89 TRINITY_DN8273_c0_g1_i4:818-1936(-)